MIKLMIARKNELQLTFRKFDLLQTKDICLHLVKIVQKALVQNCSKPVDIP
jgi:hypothetical protein